MKNLCVLGLLWAVCVAESLGAEPTASRPEFEAGVARVAITPPLPFWLSGYAARTNPAVEVWTELWAKALALRDARGTRAVIVTTDLIGLPGVISDEVATRVRNQFGLERAQLVFNSSHTHSGPAVWPNLRVLFEFNPEDQRRTQEYASRLTDSLTRVVGEALGSLAPAVLSSGHGTAGFAINRREPRASGVAIGVNPPGPTDHDVPVLKVSSPEGKLRAVLFGYACHNTTLGGDLYRVNGDYAGFAQAELEARFPEATALFCELCGGDQNPHPRGTPGHAQRYGKALAEAVSQVLAGQLTPVRSPIRASYQLTNLEFAPHTQAQFEKESQSEDRFHRRRAALMLETYAQGKPVLTTPYPVQAIRFGTDLTLLALGGEVVVDYALRTKREYPGENLIVSGYCNEVKCYIPSRRVLSEGGYEPVDSMIYYGQPGPFQTNVEDRVFAAIHQTLKEVGAGTESVGPK